MPRAARTAHSLLAFAVLAGLAGCGGDEPGDADSFDVKGKVDGAVNLLVDANRDGKVDADDDRATEQKCEGAWTVKCGASILANLDDDDLDGVRDAEDEKVNGEADALDLATIRLEAWAKVPGGAVGTLALDAASAERVRVFRVKGNNDYEPILGVGGSCKSCVAKEVEISKALIADGLVLAIEATDFRRSDDAKAWDGSVKLSWSIHEGKKKLGTDEVELRVAPWILNGNLSPIDTVWSSDVSSTLVAGISKGTKAAGVTYRKITDWDGDQWTQDIFQTGWTAIPGPGGKPIGMRVANPRAWGRTKKNKDLPIEFLRKNFLGPDRAMVQIYEKAHTGDSYDSHGNHELIPPYVKGDEAYPLGRILIGSGVLPETKEFYRAQQVQPPISVDTSWLIVGHIDEVVSSVPAKTERGWKLLVGSATLAREMLEKARADGFGDAVLFEGKEIHVGDKLVSAEVTIDEVLEDANVMKWSQQAQAAIDDIREAIQQEVGLSDDEIIEIPFLFESDGEGLISLNPGTVNLLPFGDYVVIPMPFGPTVGGADLFEKDLSDRLGSPVNKLGAGGKGLEVFFADDWDWYHALQGEVHCGSNADAPPPADGLWWEYLD